jgi:hypothetical protein
MGVTVNIIDSWEEFRAARTAVSNIIQTTEISRLASSRAQDFLVKILNEKIFIYNSLYR